MRSNDVIDGLVKDLRPVSVTRSPFTLTLIWLVLSLASAAIVILTLFRIRPDMSSLVSHPTFLILLASLIGAWMSSAYLTFVLSLPGRASSGLLRVLPYLFLAVAMMALGWELSDFSATGWAIAGAKCSAVIVVVSLAPLLLLLGMIRKLAPLGLGRTSRALLIAATALGAFGICLHCNSQEAIHLLVYHVVPIVLMIGLGSLLTRRWLRW